jgi:protoporphyrinogen oxidase
MDKKPIVISGSGLSALMIARMVRSCLKDETPIIFIEQEPEIGGQFRSFDYGQNRLFDFGMHIYYESCIPEIDRLFTGIFPDDQWNILEGNRKDIAGLFINNRLQQDTPYVDLRQYDPDFRKRCISEMFLHIEKIVNREYVPDDKIQNTAYGTTLRQFGEYVAEQVFVPIFEKLYQTHPARLDPLANHLTTINRIALFEPVMALEVLRSEAFRARICYPDQLSLPPLRDNMQRGFYPKTFGMARVIDRFRAILEKENCRFLTSSRIVSLEEQGGKVSGITVQKGDKALETMEIDRLYWTAGIPHLAKLLGIGVQDLPYDPNNKDIFYVNLLLENPPQMGELYYFYCFDPGFRTFRVTNFANYCPSAAPREGFPVCMEMWMQNNDPKELDQVIDRARSELMQFGVLPNEGRVSLAKAEKVAAGGFPLPSVNNVRFLETTRDRIQERGVSNLEMFGVYSAKNTFFIKDILTDAYNKLVISK